MRGRRPSIARMNELREEHTVGLSLSVMPSSPASRHGLSDVDRESKRIKPFKILLADPPAKDDDYDKAYPNLGLLQLISYTTRHTPLGDDDILFLDQFHSVEDHVRMIEEHRPLIYG